MAKAARRGKKKIYGLFDGHEIVDIGSWDSLYALIPYFEPTGDIISLDNMYPSAMRRLKAEIRLRKKILKMTSE
jgi:nicotinate-nucleotide pyrophosphorylase